MFLCIHMLPNQYLPCGSYFTFFNGVGQSHVENSLVCWRHSPRGVGRFPTRAPYASFRSGELEIWRSCLTLDYIRGLMRTAANKKQTKAKSNMP